MQHLLLLHGAIGSSAQLLPLAEELKSQYHVHRFDFPGHGGKEPPETFSIEAFAGSVVQFLDEQQLSTVSVFGYSMGGYVALYLAKYYPSRIDRVITLATKFEWDPSIADKEIKMLQPGLIEQKLPSFAETLARRHAPQDWKMLLQQTALMLLHLGLNNTLKPSDYPGINKPALLMVGDSDKMVSIEETLEVYRKLPDGQFAVLPGTPHLIEQINTGLILAHINFFLSGRNNHGPV